MLLLGHPCQPLCLLGLCDVGVVYPGRVELGIIEGELQRPPRASMHMA